MNKRELVQVLDDWNSWNHAISFGIIRPDYLGRISDNIHQNRIVVLTGARRSGKSYILRQLMNQLVKEKKLQKNEIMMINLEDPRLSNLTTTILDEIFEAYVANQKPKNKPLLLLDEIQEIKDWEKWVLMMTELEKADIVVTGSNSKLLSQELSTLLTGRHIQITVYPFSFVEYMNLLNINPAIEADSALDGYIQYGGFPTIIKAANKEEMLIQYASDILSKDLVMRYRVRKTQEIRNLMNYYLSNPACMITYTSLKKYLQMSVDTIIKFSEYLQSAYLIFFVKRYSEHVKEQEKSPKKVYAIDTGLSQAVGFHNSANLGRMLENVIFLSLKKLEELIPISLYYWKDDRNREVDFVLVQNYKIQHAIQVCENVKHPKTMEREIKSLLSCLQKNDLQQGIIITRNYSEEKRVEDKLVNFVPAYLFLQDPLQFL
jgi:predicted AAA+ superfamily ATPase